MSRFSDDYEYDVDSILAGGRWVARRNKVLKGRPGQSALRNLERALTLMPHKKLMEGNICDGANVCVIGAWLYRQYVDEGMTPKRAWAKLQEGRGRHHDSDSWEELERTIDKGSADLGITRTLTEVVAYVNDEEGFRMRDWEPERRYERVLAWVRGVIKEPRQG